MLIICPECNKEISDKAENCIHCGFPLSQIPHGNICIIDGKVGVAECISVNDLRHGFNHAYSAVSNKRK